MKLEIEVDMKALSARAHAMAGNVVREAIPQMQAALVGGGEGELRDIVTRLVEHGFLTAYSAAVEDIQRSASHTVVMTAAPRTLCAVQLGRLGQGRKRRK